MDDVVENLLAIIEELRAQRNAAEQRGLLLLAALRGLRGELEDLSEYIEDRL